MAHKTWRPFNLITKLNAGIFVKFYILIYGLIVVVINFFIRCIFGAQDTPDKSNDAPVHF